MSERDDTADAAIDRGRRGSVGDEAGTVAAVVA